MCINESGEQCICAINRRPLDMRRARGHHKLGTPGVFENVEGAAYFVLRMEDAFVYGVLAPVGDVQVGQATTNLVAL